MKSFVLKISFLLAFCISCSTLVIAQKVSPQAYNQIVSALGSKGISEAEMREALSAKGIDVANLTEEEIIKNKAIIEKTVAELEAKKKQASAVAEDAAKQAANVAPLTPSTAQQSTIDMNDLNVVTKKVEQTATKVQVQQVGIYGHQLFQDNTIDIFRVSKDASPSDNYVLGAGDKINIIIFGKSQADLRYEINTEGYIQPASMPKIFLGGLTLKQARELLTNRFSTYYIFNHDQFALTLNTSRTLTVNIFGEVGKAGTYTTSALNTALNMLAVCGGPNEMGTVRNIQIIRGGEKKIFDIYSFLLNPASQFDFYLQNKDIIYVPAAEKIVSIQGAVHRPLRYELKANEQLKELIEFAGGLTVDAYKEWVQIERIENNQTVVRDYALNAILNGTLTLNLQNGDVIRIKSIYANRKQTISISGAVEYPGTYDLNANPNGATLLKRAKLLSEAKLDQALLTRVNPDRTTQLIPLSLTSILADTNFHFQAEDNLLVYNQYYFIDQFSLKIYGEVRNPGYIQYDSKLSLKDIIINAGGATFKANLSNVEVFRVDFQATEKPVTKLISLELDSQFNIKNNKDFQLRPFDVVVLRSVPEFKLQEFAQVSGEVRLPGAYLFPTKKHDFYLSDLIKTAGGITDRADPDNIVLTRIINGPTVLGYQSEKVLKHAHNKDYDPILLPGDMLTVPRIYNTVTLLNSGIKILGKPTNFEMVYVKGKRANWYIENFAGGFDDKADKNKVFVYSASGMIKKTENYLFFRAYPKVYSGEKIVVNSIVPPKPKVVKEKEEKPPRKPLDWNNLTNKMISIATALALISFYNK
jgi:protein involved in polysaccharide export with SLBB domain